MEPQNPEAPEPAVAPPDGKPRASRFERREKAACDALRTLLRDVSAERFSRVPPKGGEIDLVLRLKAVPEKNWELVFDPPLGEQVIPQIEDAQAEWGVFRRGRLHCFRCESSDCEHARPPGPLAVFNGYEPNGLPEWIEFAQALIAAKDEDVGRLFEDPPGTVARVQYGHELKTRQLSSFGRSSKTYAILGQVIAGYFPLPATVSAGSRLALTFQVVEVRDEQGQARLHLNVLAGVGGDETLSELLGSGWQSGIHRAREIAARELDEIGVRSTAHRLRGDTAGARERMKEVPQVLRRLAESLARTNRQESRRTRHVERRRQEQRPVHKALEDALSVQPGMVFADEKAGTAVACGPQNRAHVFNPDGRHVTSFLIGPAGIEHRLRTKRWRVMQADETARFLERIRSFVPRRDGDGEGSGNLPRI